jgi:ComF family protein
MQYLLKDFLWLFFPPSCPGCEKTMLRAESWLCTGCRKELIRQTYQATNVLNLKIRAELPVAGVYALFPFQRHGRLQRILHALKYRHQPHLGLLLGQWLGEQLQSLSWASQADFIVPVPLHPSKLRKRGYNQAEKLAEGIAKQVEKPLLARALRRAAATETQTHKSRLERWRNVSAAFVVEESSAERLQGKTVILVDDVVTTGATLQACAQALFAAGCRTVYLAALAGA